MSPSFGFLVADDPRMHVDIFIPQDKYAGAANGQKVLAKMTGWEKWKKNPTGEIIEVLVKNGQPIEFDQPLFKIKKS